MPRLKYKHIKLILLGLPLLTGTLLVLSPSLASAANFDCDQTTCQLTCNDGTQTNVVTTNLGAGTNQGDAYSTSLTGGKTATEFCSKHGGIKSILRTDGKSVAHSGGNAASTSAYPQCQTQNGKNYCSHQCGSGSDAVMTSINIGCKGVGNPIIDMTFAVIRFLSYGVGLVIIASVIFAGIQYTVSRDEPQAVAAAEARIKSSVIALIIFIFAYAILNYVIPAGFFSQ